MGPSGSGKSTLLDVLAGRIIKETNSKKSLTGDILVNGEEVGDSFKRLSAYGKHRTLKPQNQLFRILIVPILDLCACSN